MCYFIPLIVDSGMVCCLFYYNLVHDMCYSNSYLPVEME